MCRSSTTHSKPRPSGWSSRTRIRRRAWRRPKTSTNRPSSPETTTELAMAPSLPGGVVHDPAQELEDELSRQQAGVAGGHVEERIHLDQIEADNFVVLRDMRQGILQLVIGQTAHLG